MPTVSSVVFSKEYNVH